MAKLKHFGLVADRKGVVWDLLLYIPTVVALASIATSFWFNEDRSLGYLFYFLTCFFLIAGTNRIFKTRLMLFPSSTISMAVESERIVLELKNGIRINLVKNIRYYGDYAGKSFGISGMDGEGRQAQYVFLKGQFTSIEEFESAQDALKKLFK